MGVNGDNDLYMVNVYGYFITGVNGSCVIWPAVCEARRKVLAILSAKNPCSTFFNNSPYLLLSKFFSGDSETAADVFASDQIDTYSGPAFITQQGGTLSDPVIANTTQGTGSDSQINVNQNGGFFKGSAFISVDGTVTTETGFLTVGGPSTYAGGTLGAQVTALLHEFAHNVGRFRQMPEMAHNPWLTPSRFWQTAKEQSMPPDNRIPPQLTVKRWDIQKFWNHVRVHLVGPLGFFFLLNPSTTATLAQCTIRASHPANDIFFLEQSDGWIVYTVGTTKYIARTRDRGETWAAFPIHVPLTKVLLPNSPSRVGSRRELCRS